MTCQNFLFLLNNFYVKRAIFFLISKSGLKTLITRSLIIQASKLIIKLFLFISYGAMFCQLVFQKYFGLFSLKKERYG